MARCTRTRKGVLFGCELTRVAEALAEIWSVHRGPARPETIPVPEIGEIPAELIGRVRELEATEVFRSIYSPRGAVFAMVPIGHIVTPQWWLDTAYVDALADAVPAQASRPQ